MSFNRTAKHLSLFSLLVAVTAINASTFAASSAHQNHDHASAPATLSLNAGKKWETDQPLRNSMTSIRTSMDASLDRIHEGKFSTANYGALAKKINDAVSNMVSNCKLEPKADDQLHLIIAQLLEGAEAMEGKTKGAKRMDGAVRVLGALENYGNYFADPSWKPIKH